ncbi:DUF2231 domain-containing protein [Streptomyces sp. JH34]|uniref:DUF2231 domain-containing protein n=1 Tax=unclassified Streptomyces TaxID=2593676 RepID=UPI0023F6F599|nr:DUF2231 domain-containing protein [Streptomyces sp. JH34]MDF6023083.1 hypothetical protein [Streptomyces sp. JH34]
MGPTEINGIPAHPLLVHFVVVLVPLTALALLACALWPSVMRRLGLSLPVLALVTLVAVPLTTRAGEWLAERVNENAQLERHTEMGDGLLPWGVGLFVMATALWWTYRRVGMPSTREVNGSVATSGKHATTVRIAAVLLSLVVAVGAIVQVYRIGDSGAKATWGAGEPALPVARMGA